MKGKFKKIAFKRWWLVLALLVGLVFGFYHWVIPSLWGIDNYSALSLNQQSPSFAVDETIFYGSKVQEILDGHWQLGDVMIWEYKDKASPFIGEWLVTVIMAGLSEIGGGVNQGFMLADFIWPAIAFLILTSLIYSLTKREDLAAIGALMVMFLANYLSYFPYLPSVARLMYRAIFRGTYSPLIRSFHPQISLSFFVGWMLVLWLMVKTKQGEKYWWLVGIGLAGLVYSHFFYWTFALAFLGLYFFRYQKRVAKALGLAGVLTLPYWLRLYQFKQSALSEDFLAKVNYQPGLGWKTLGLLILGFLVSLLVVKKKNLSNFWQRFYLTGLILIGVSAMIKLGLDDPIGHWLIRVIYPMTVVLVMVIVAERVKKLPEWLSILLVLILMGYQARVHWQYFKHQARAFQIEPERLELFEWLNHNTEKDSVVITSSLKDNLYLPVYTHNNVFIPRAQLSLAPTGEALERFLTVNKLAGTSEEELRRMFLENKDLKAKKRFEFDNCAGVYLYFRQYAGSDYYNCSVPEEKLDQILAEYDEVEPSLSKWRADYWLTQSDKQIFANWPLVWENKKYQVYKL